MNDYKELIAGVRGDAAFRHIISECGADGKVWFDKRFIRDYVSHLKYAIEQLIIERYELTAKCYRLEQELDTAVAAVHKQCSTCKRVDFCATDAGQPTLWACVSAAKCNWEWRGVQEDNDEID